MNALDASALLALLFREPGFDRVAPVVHGSIMSTVNRAEVLTRLVRDGRTLGDVLPSLDGMGIRWISFDAGQAGDAAELFTVTRRFGLSLADRACLALARSRNAVAVTADRTWANLDIGIAIDVIR